MRARGVLREIPDYKKYFKTLGNMGVVCSIATIKAKLEERGNICMFFMLCVRLYWWHTPHAKSTHKMYCTNP